MMKKLLAITGLGISLLGLLAPFEFALAQSLTTAPLTNQPAPRTTQQLIDPYLQLSSGGSASTTGITIPGATGTTTGTTGTQTGSTISPGGISSSMQTVDPDVPLVPSPTTDQTHDPNQICTADRCAATVAITGKNQLATGYIMFAGSFIGGMLWILSMLMSKGQVVDRESSRMERENRLHFMKKLTAEKMKRYGAFVDSVSELMNSLQHKKPLNAAAMRTYQDSSIFVSMHSSDGLQNINDQIGALFSSGKPLASKDAVQLRNDLTKAMRSDLFPL